MVFLFRKVIRCFIVVILCQIILSKLIKSPKDNFPDCEKHFQNKCLIQCGILKRILCFCKDIKDSNQVDHRCICAANTSECDKELDLFERAFIR